MATSSKVTVAPKPSLMPKPLRHLLNGTSELCEAFEIACTGIKKTTAGIDEVTALMLSQQKEKLLAELA